MLKNQMGRQIFIKKGKRALALLTAISLLVTLLSFGASAAGSVTITAVYSDTVLLPNEEFTVDLNLSGVSPTYGIGEITLYLTYTPSKLLYVSSTANPNYTVLMDWITDPNKVKIIFDDDANPILSDCTLATVTFKVLPETLPGTTNVTLSKGSIKDKNDAAVIGTIAQPATTVITIEEEATPTPTPTPEPTPTPTATPFADNIDTWQFGGDNPPEGQDGTAQGQNGWYFMYSDEINAQGDLNENMVNECVWCSDMWSGLGYWVPGGEYIIWQYDPWIFDSLWRWEPDGTHHMENKEYSAVVGWSSPSSGIYKFDVIYDAGSMGTEWEGIYYPSDGDGMTVSAFTADHVLYHRATTTGPVQPYEVATGLTIGEPYEGALYEENETYTITTVLTAGEMIYFAGDPNSDAEEDNCHFDISVTRIPADNETIWQFGGDNLPEEQDGTAQGQNGWHYMWTPEYNIINNMGPQYGGMLDVSQIADCTWSTSGSVWFFWVGAGWVPDIYLPPYDPIANNNWWYQTANGINNPAVALGEQATSVIGWEAPSAGTYTFDVTYTAGGQEAWSGGVISPSHGDGLTLSVNTASGRLWHHSTETGMVQAINEETGLPVGEPYQGALFEENQTFTVSVTLAEGEMIYFAADPNMDGSEDVCYFNIIAQKDPIVWGNYLFDINRYLMNLEVQTNANELASDLTLPENTTIKVLDPFGEDMLSPEYSWNFEFVPTGATVEVYIDGILDAQYTVVLRGDVNGDGYIDSGDMLAIRRYMMGINSLNNAGRIAGDADKDGYIDSGDILTIRRFMLGLGTIDQTP